MSDLSKVFDVDDILRVSIVSQVEHHLYFPESFLCTLCMNVPYYGQRPTPPPIDGFTLYDEPPVHGVDDYLSDPDYPVEAYF